MKKVKGYMIILALIIVFMTINSNYKAEAADKYIKIKDFIEYIVKQMNWPIDEKSDQPYIDSALENGIIKKGEFKNYSDYLTRTDAAVIANRLDEKTLSYLFTEDAIIFLRECDLFEGRLYYNVSGKFFPKGETIETYDARKFGQEVVYPILKSTFPTENWIEQGIRTRYTDVYDKDGKVIKTVIMIGKASPDKNNVVEIEPIDEKSKVIDMWNYIKDLDRKINTVLEKRISDIKNIPKSKREAVAAVIAKGIMKGYSNGLYATSREFRGKNKITAIGAKEVIQKVINPDKRALVSPDGQLIRTTNLPKNANDYPYILECFPNEYYEMNYRFMYLDSFKNKENYGQYAYPKEINYNYLYENYYNYQFNINMDKYELYDLAISQVEKYLKHIFNVDYKTIDDKWKEGLESSFAQGNYDWRIKGWINNYVDNIKKNHVVIESKYIAIDPGTLYYCAGDLYVRAYVKYKITADNINIDHSKLLYGSNTYLKDLKNGQWREGYYDIQIATSNTDYGYMWGVHSLNSINDGWNNLLK